MSRRVLGLAFLLAHTTGLLLGCAIRSPASTVGQTSGFEWVELATGLRIDRARRVVEFDGQVAIDAHHEDTPIVWLELMVTGPDSREHESLVVTRVKPSLIHAAMLAVGLEPGHPGRIDMNSSGQIMRTLAAGDRVRIEFLATDAHGHESSHTPAAWVSHAQTGVALEENGDWDGYVFTGSREVTRQGRNWYDADGTGVIVGLSTFGSEVIGTRMSLSHESVVDEAVWIANRDRVPARGTPVRVRVWAD